MPPVTLTHRPLPPNTIYPTGTAVRASAGKLPQDPDWREAPEMHRIEVPGSKSSFEMPAPHEHVAANRGKLEQLYGQDAVRETLEAKRNTYNNLRSAQRNMSGEETEAFGNFMRGQDPWIRSVNNSVQNSSCFEDAVFAILIKIVSKEQNRVMNEIKTLERESAGVGKFLRSQASNLAGMAGAAVGGLFGGTAAAGVGREIGKTAAEHAVGNEASRQIKFEKMKKMIQDLSTLEQVLSSIGDSMHQTGLRIAQKM